MAGINIVALAVVLVLGLLLLALFEECAARWRR
jgi:hypothetical protein